MNKTWRTVRVFVSSTFRDMQAERHHLVRFVFPRLREELLKRRIHLVDVDLRWGVTSEQDVSEVCREIIDECRPYFLCMLGGRYGRVPPGSTRSITADEVHYGVLDRPLNDRGFPHFYFRDEVATAAMTETTPGEFHEPRGSDNQNKLSELKQDIIAAGLNPFTYPAQWDNESRRLTGLKEFGDHVYDDLLASIKSDPALRDHFVTDTVEQIDEFAEENAAMEAFVTERSERFVLGSRETVLEELLAHASATSGNGYVCLTGAPGSGKSALLAHLSQHSVLNNQPSTLVVRHFVGASPGSTDVRRTLRRLCHELKASCPDIPDDIPDDPEKLRAAFPDFLEQACARRHVVILLDAVNQFDPAPHSAGLHWLPEDLPANARVILSALDGPALEELRRRPHKPREIELKPLTADDGEAIIEQFRKHYRKEFEPEQIELLLGKDESGKLNKTDSDKPLYLLAALEELRTLGTYEEISQRIAELPPTTHEMFAWILRRLEDDDGFRDAAGRRVGRELVSRFAALLGASRHGLSQCELADLLDLGDPQGNVAALLHLLRPYLMRRGELLDFYHGQLGDAVGNRYLSDAAERIEAHKTIADYFETRWREPSEHALAELPFQLIKSKRHNNLNRLLKNVTFLDSKISANMVYELLLDFALIEEKNLDKTLIKYRNFISNRIQYFIQNPTYFLPELFSEHVQLQMQENEIKKINKMLINKDLPWLEPKLCDSLSESYIMSPILAIAFSNDDSIIATGDISDMITVWDGELKSIKTRFYKPARSRRGSAFNSLFILDDNRHLLCVFDNGEIHTVSLETGITSNTSGRTTDDTTKVYKAENYLLLVPPFYENHNLKIYQIDDLYLREIECNFPPGEDLPIWVGPQMLCVSLNQTIYDLKKKTKIGRLNLKSVPPSYKCEPFITSTPPYIILDDSTCLHVGETITFHRYSTGDILKSFNTNDLFENNDKRRPEFVVCYKKKKVVFWMYNILVSVDITNFKYNKIFFDMNIGFVVHNPEEEFLYLSLYDGDMIYGSKLFELKVIDIDSFIEIHSQKCPPIENPNTLINKGGPYIILNNERMMDVDKNIEIITLPKGDKFWSNTQYCDPFLGYNETKELVYSIDNKGGMHPIAYFNRNPPKNVLVSRNRDVLVCAEGSHGGSSLQVLKSGELKDYTIHKSCGDYLFTDLHPNGKWFLATVNLRSGFGITIGSSIYLLDIENNIEKHSEEHILSSMNVALFIPNTKSLAIAFNDGTIQVRNFDLEIIWSNKIHHDYIYSMAISPDGHLIASCGAERHLVISDANNGERIISKPFVYGINDCIFSDHENIIIKTDDFTLIRYFISIEHHKK